MKFAYADPPYLGYAEKFYGDPTYDSVYAHGELIRSLGEYDGWAYSLNSTTLQELMPIFPKGVRFGSWVKPFCSFKPNVNPAYAWEPVVFYGGRSYERYESDGKRLGVGKYHVEKRTHRSQADSVQLLDIRDAEYET